MKKVLDHNCPNCDAVLKFNPKYQNWKCEQCRKESAKGSRKMIIETFKYKMKKTISRYNSIEIEEHNFYFRRECAKYVLLPIWFINIKYKNDIYCYVINGQSGKIKYDVKQI